ncbi:uncharacterized protein LOC134284515 [Aedes albopictus]|uniref:Peptidase aspartic putative domain-containing protein n=1 Tax=Aedes albopictus TaxID=7160 RepID=A0ABM1ZVX2_AEDAL
MRKLEEQEKYLKDLAQPSVSRKLDNQALAGPVLHPTTPKSSSTLPSHAESISLLVAGPVPSKGCDNATSSCVGKITKQLPVRTDAPVNWAAPPSILVPEQLDDRYHDSKHTRKYNLPIDDRGHARALDSGVTQHGISPPTFRKMQTAPASIREDSYQYQRNCYPDAASPCPTASQLAARQVMTRELPTFSGDPEDWPIFYSSFKNSTAVCGPEILINSLLRRVRSSPTPKADNLKSIVDYGLTVQNLIDHMVLSEQQAHLTNPLLLNELVEKLPTQFKLQWSSFKQTQLNVNLATFNSFISNLVCLASDLLVNSESYHANTKGSRMDKHKEKLFVHCKDRSEEPENAEQTPEPIQDRPFKTCTYCEEESHQISNCETFRSLTVDARWKAVWTKNLCRTCLVPHRKWPCRSRRECGLDNCRSRHHPMLHAQYTQHEQVPRQTDDNLQAHQNHHRCQSVSLFRYLPVKLFANGKTVTIFAFLDDGSSTMLLEAGVAEQLGLDGPSASLWLSWTGNITREEKGSKRVSLTIAGENSKQKYAINNIQTVDELHLPEQSFHYDSLAETYPHLAGLPLRNYSNVVPQMIIGLEHVRLLTALKTREGKNGGPVVVKTRLGWCAFGKESDGVQLSVHLNHHFEESMTNQSLHEAMRNYFAVEESAVTVKPEADDDKRAVQILEQTTVKKGTRYETGLLWRADSPSLPDSLPMAINRLKSLERRLARNPELAKNVGQQIGNYIDKGYAHKASAEELQDTDPRHVWYLPLGVVVNSRKPGKIRLIWDAAAKVQGTSFNDLLLKGPDLLVSLVSVILRFRERNIAVCGDICEMFHQIENRSADKQYQRFLWRYDPKDEIEVYVMDVATFGATCSPCSAQYIKNRNADAHASMYPRAAKAITENHYVDDFLDSTDTVEEAIDLVNQVKIVHSDAGFEIRKFRSNSSEVLAAIGECEETSGKPINCGKQTIGDRVLGLIWDPKADVFTFDASCLNIPQLLNGCEIPTKSCKYTFSWTLANAPMLASLPG